VAQPSSALTEGLRGSYVLGRPIGEGGMATVYLAQDVKHSRPVALKVLKPELAQSLGPERFRREITTAARLQHPHILSVFDSGETAGQLWFTMPYVEGETLRERLKRERCLPLDDALRIARETAQALQYAHERGIVHRDIKPENILLTPDGSTLVADFGIARALGSEDGGNFTGEQLTQTGSAIGTPQYMAPEQATGDKAVDARADQYALAATLYEMLAGEPPFTANSAAALVAKRFTSPTPSVRTTRAEMPASVDVALQRGLALRADDRFATIAEFARAFAPASIVTPAVSRPWPRPRPARRVGACPSWRWASASPSCWAPGR
jgi:serine/threonine-protein kinase